MRRLMLVVAAALALGWTPSVAQDASGAIRSVIAGQIEAFRADDFETAFGFASPGIRQMFGTPDTFGRMVRGGYPMVWRPAEVRFANLVTHDGRPVQSVIVTDQAGRLHVLDYEMVPVEDGWRINGVTIRESGGYSS